MTSTVRVHVAEMQCSNGRFYYTILTNDQGRTIEPFMSRCLGQANAEASAWAAFFDLPVEHYVLTAAGACQECHGSGVEDGHTGGDMPLICMVCEGRVFAAEAPEPLEP